MASDAQGEAGLDEPIAYFTQDLRFHGRSDRTVRAYNRVLTEFERFVQARGSSLSEATRRDCMAWVHDIREDEKAPSTVATYASYVHRFFDYMSRIDAFESNPMAVVIEEMNESVETDPERRDISIDRMRLFVETVNHPLHLGVILTLLKTGIRVGELCNLDLRDLYVDDSDVNQTYEVDPRGALDERPNSLYVSNEPMRGATYNGETRAASNKRKRTTVIPIDNELKEVIKAWLAVRPDARSRAEPLFCSTSEWGRRVTPAMIRSIVTSRAKQEGWYRPSGGAEENVTPHYFRHFFTTHLRDRAGDRGIVKYLRGDVADDVIDTYTHNWGDRVREIYEANIYSLR